MFQFTMQRNYLDASCSTFCGKYREIITQKEWFMFQVSFWTIGALKCIHLISVIKWCFKYIIKSSYLDWFLKNHHCLFCELSGCNCSIRFLYWNVTKFQYYWSSLSNAPSLGNFYENYRAVKESFWQLEIFVSH